MVREICEHMTEDEQARHRRLGQQHGGRAGTWIGWTIAGPLTFGVMLAQFWRLPVLIAAGVLVAVVGVARLVRLNRSASREIRAFLASTEWARAWNVTVDRIRLYQFRP